MKILTRKEQKVILEGLARLAAMAYPEAKRIEEKEYLSSLSKSIAVKVGGQEGFLDVQIDFLSHIKRLGYED